MLPAAYAAGQLAPLLTRRRRPLTRAAVKDQARTAGAALDRILIVDSDPHVRNALRRLMVEHRVECDAVGSLVGAMGALRTCGPYAVMLATVGAPEGRCPLALARELDPKMGVVAVAQPDPVLAARALELGAWGFVARPLEISQVTIALLGALSRHRAERAAYQRVEVPSSTHRVATPATADSKPLGREFARRLMALSGLRDGETSDHMTRIGSYAAALGSWAGLSAADVELLRWAGPLHDIGKVGIADAVLKKPGRHTPDETVAMRQHTEIGHRVLSGTDIPLLQMAAEIARSHHERWDGEGYPRRLAGGAIPIEGRIVAIVDVFDALVSKRVYKPAFPVEQAVAVMKRGRGTQFDPELLDLFTANLNVILAIRGRIPERRPVGARASNGYIAKRTNPVRAASAR